MFFDTPIYFVFLTTVVGIYWLLGHKAQNRMLLVASYVFYGWWDWRFLGLILLSTVVDFFCAIAVEDSKSATARKWLMGASVTLNLVFLGFFKYFNFFVDSMQALLSLLGLNVPTRTLEILLPPGISFYTFQAIAYMVDVYRGRLPATRSMGDYALFIALFPHLIAGPIQRPDHLLPQVAKPRRFDPASWSGGVMLIINGLFRKCVIADQAALIANAAFSGSLGPPDIGVVALGAYAFAWQIYGDFSGYSNIARGSAQLLGFHFMVNFRQPYLSTSIQEFWRRWHISLSTWLRDYLYIGLGGSRGGTARTYRNLVATMLIGGLWHGANWTFVIWGGLHGCWLAIERALRGERTSGSEGVLARWLKRIALFHGVCVAWVFFRAESVADAVRFLSGALRPAQSPHLTSLFLYLAIFTVPLLLLDVAEDRRKEEYWGQNSTNIRQLAIGVLLLVLVVAFTANETTAFIYFQF